VAFGLDVGEREFNLTINTTGSNESGVERLDPVGGHDNFDVSSCVEPVELIKEF
jgi:hypothetical protein